ncbi:ParB/RepB/Spo0J family partition protein [Comamonas testosteroni]|uniref:ParB/RepB/Spo0J family partition protein n=1 Tax=Comamonas testosteroni TaxID=285 RepID=UPI0005B3BBA9|nr:ParB/RepB/Spo0J family partition protein [Comamonas testosteroni]
MSLDNAAGQHNSNETANLFPVTLREESPPSEIAMTHSELDALDSDRADDIRGFTDDAIIQVKSKDLSKKYLGNRDSNTLFVALDDLRIYKGLNPRLPSAEWNAHIDQLARSIEAHGFWEFKPIYAFAAKNGKNNVLFIADGESRYRAAIKARDELGAAIDVVPVRLAPETMSVEEIIMQLAPANETRSFSPLEKGLLAQRMISYRKTVAEIATNFKCSTEYVHQLLLLASAPSKVRQMVSDGAVPAALAIDAMRGPEPEKAVQNLQQAVATAKAQGKTKATAQHMPDYAQKRAVASNSPSLHSVVQKLHTSESFLLLEEDLRNEIAALLEKINTEAKPKEPKKKEPKKVKGEKPGDGTNADDSQPPASSDDKQGSLLDDKTGTPGEGDTSSLPNTAATQNADGQPDNDSSEKASEQANAQDTTPETQTS